MSGALVRRSAVFELEEEETGSEDALKRWFSEMTEDGDDSRLEAEDVGSSRLRDRAGRGGPKSLSESMRFILRRAFW